MCFVFFANFIMNVITFFDNLTTFLSNITFVNFTHFVFVFIVNILTIIVFAKINFFKIRRHFKEFKIK